MTIEAINHVDSSAASTQQASARLVADAYGQDSHQNSSSGGIGGFFSGLAHDVVQSVETVGRVSLQIGKGIVDEAEHHPLDLLKDAAIGAVTTAAIIAVPELALPALAIGGFELASHAGDIINTAKDFGHDVSVEWDPSQHSQQEIDQVNTSLQHIGEGTAQLAAGVIGGVGAGFAVNMMRSAAASSAIAGDSAQLDSVAPNAVPGAADGSATNVQLAADAKPGVVSAGTDSAAAPESASAATSAEGSLERASTTAGDSAAGTVTNDGATAASEANALSLPSRDAAPLYPASSPDAPQALTPEQVSQYIQMQKDQGLEFTVQKGIYPQPASLEQVDATTAPQGAWLTSSENKIQLSSDLTLPNGTTLPAGTELPNGVRIEPQAVQSVTLTKDVTLPDGTIVKAGDPVSDFSSLVAADRAKIATADLSGVRIVTPPGGVQLADGTTLTSTSLPDGTTVPVEGGQYANPDDWIVSRSVTGREGVPRIDTYTNTPAKMVRNWMHADGTPIAAGEDPADGLYQPNVLSAEPSQVVPINNGDYLRFEASYGGQVSNRVPAWIKLDGDGGYILTEDDMLGTHFGVDPRSQAFLNQVVSQINSEAPSPISTAIRPEFTK